MLCLMSERKSSSLREQSASESAQCQDIRNQDVTGSNEESPTAGQVEQRAAPHAELEATEGHYRTGLVRALTQLTPDAFEVNSVLEDLRALIEETVRREVGALRRELNAKLESLSREMNAKLESLDSRFKMMCWAMGLMAMMQLAIFAALVQILLREDRPPPPPSPTLQEPAVTEAVPPTVAVPDSQAPARAEPDEPSVAEDPPTPSQGLGSADDNSARVP